MEKYTIKALLAIFASCSLVVYLALAATLFIFFTDARDHAASVKRNAISADQELHTLSHEVLPVYYDLNQAYIMTVRFGQELELIALDGERDRQYFRTILDDLKRVEFKLNNNWPDTIPELHRKKISNYLLILIDIGYELLDSSSPNQILQLYSDTQDVIEEINASQLKTLIFVKDEVAKTESLSDYTEKEAEHLDEMLASGMYLLLLLMSLLAILFVLFNYRVINALKKRLDRVSEYSREIESGNYDVNIPELPDDQTGQLAKKIESMANKLVQKIVERQELLEKTDAASQAKSDFLAKVSHELRTPMNGIQGFISILSSSELDKQQRQSLNLLDESAIRLMSVIEDMLFYVDSKHGGMELDNAQFNLKDVINRVASAFNNDAKLHSIDYRKELYEIDNLGSVIGDKKKITTILSHLLENAFKFTDQGFVSISGRVIGHTSNKVSLLLEVSDSGKGMTDLEINNAFDLFSQGNSRSNREHEGLGLGLSVVKQSVDALGGTINIVSNIGEGSKVEVCLDLVLDSSVGDEQNHTPLIKNKSQALVKPCLSGKKVLVAEDVPVNEVIISAVLNSLNIEHDVVNDGESAVAYCKTGKYDLVLMDAEMPLKSGLSAAEDIRASVAGQAFARIPIIGLTSKDVEDEQCLSAGMNETISKPINAVMLERLLNKWRPQL